MKGKSEPLQGIKVEVALGWLLLVAFTFPIFIRNVGLLFEQILTILLMGISVFIIATTQAGVKKDIATPFLLILTFACLTLLSLIISGNDVIFRDVVELAKPVYLGIFFIVSYLCKWRYPDFVRFINIVLALFIGLGIWGILEANVSIVNNVSGVLYKETRNSLQFKAITSFIVPYVYGSLMIWPMWYFLLASLFQKNRLLHFIGFSICFLAIVFSQSRTIILSIAFSLVYFGMFAFFAKWLPKRNIVIAAIYLFITLASAVVIVFYDELRILLGYMVKGLELVVTSLQAGGFNNLLEQHQSVGLRFAQIMFAIQNQMLLPIIGVGIGKALFMPESFYALYLYRYGLLGIAIHVAIVFMVWSRSIQLAKAIKYDYGKKEFSFFLATSLYMVSLPVSYLSSSINDFTRTGFFFYVLAGLVFALHRRIVLGKL